MTRRKLVCRSSSRVTGGLVGIGITVAAASVRASASVRAAKTSQLQEAEATSALLLNQFGLAVLMIIICAVIHILLTHVIIKGYHNDALRRWMRRSTFRQVMIIALAALITFIAMAMQILAWALLYLQIGALNTMEKALYFSGVSFTTLGYGDVTLQPHYRVLGSFEALVGILMAGWSTALLVAGIQKIIAIRRDSRQTDSNRPL